MQKCEQLLVRGKVQDVGFRGRIENFGRGFNIRGYVQNEKDGSIKILCGGEIEDINNFIQLIKNMIVISDIEIKDLPPNTYYFLPYPFENVHTDEEEDIGRKLDIGNDYLRNINKKLDKLDKLDTIETILNSGFTELKVILERIAHK
jgi:acylphosphatase